MEKRVDARLLVSWRYIVSIGCGAVLDIAGLVVDLLDEWGLMGGYAYF